MHKQCNLTGASQTDDTCECCVMTKKTALNYRFSDKETYDKGSGISIFFEYMIFLCVWMLVKFLMSDLPRIVNANPGDPTGEALTVWQAISTREEGYSLSTGVLDLLTILLMIGLSMAMRRRQLVHENRADQLVTSEADFNLFVTDIPLVFTTDTDIEETITVTFQKMARDVVIEVLNRPADSAFAHAEELVRSLHQRRKEATGEQVVAKICAVYDVSKIEHFSELCSELGNQMIASFKGGDMALYRRQKVLLEQLIDTKGRETRKFQNSNDPGSQIAFFTGKIFLSFAFEEYKELVLWHYGRHPDYWNFQGLGLVRMEAADEPSGIKWGNMHYTKAELRGRWVIASLAGAMFIFYSLVIVFILYKVKHEQDE